MKRCAPWLVLPIIAVLGAATPSTAADPLGEHIRAVIDAPEYKQAHWGMLVVEAATGKTIYELNADRLFTPASTTKLFSCASALCLLGPDYRFETPVYVRGTRSGGTIRGDLILVASGDLSFGGRAGKDGTLVFTDNDHIYAN